MTRRTKIVLVATATFFTAPVSFAGHDPVVIFEPGFVPPELQKKRRETPVNVTTSSIASAAATKSITDALTLANTICFGGASEYLVSCLADQLSTIADAMPQTGDYAESARILKEASEKLKKLARENRALGKPTIRYSTKVGDRTVTTGALIAVKTASIPTVNQQAAAILEETQTLLLRSTSNSDRRKSHYAAMARVVGSTKVLLRSL